jgi:hypothetical protein
VTVRRRAASSADATRLASNRARTHVQIQHELGLRSSRCSKDIRIPRRALQKTLIQKRREGEPACGPIDVPQTPCLWFGELQPGHLPVLASDLLKERVDRSRCGTRQTVCGAQDHHAPQKGKPRSTLAVARHGRNASYPCARHFILEPAPHSESASAFQKRHRERRLAPLRPCSQNDDGPAPIDVGSPVIGSRRTSSHLGLYSHDFVQVRSSRSSFAAEPDRA